MKGFLQVYEKFKAGELPPRLPEAKGQDMWGSHFDKIAHIYLMQTSAITMRSLINNNCVNCRTTHIIERLLKSENFNLEELKMLVRQATESPGCENKQ